MGTSTIPAGAERWASRASAAVLAGDFHEAARCWDEAAAACLDVGRQRAADGFTRKANILRQRISDEELAAEVKAARASADGERCTAATAAITSPEERIMRRMTVSEWITAVKAAGGEAVVSIEPLEDGHPLGRGLMSVNALMAVIGYRSSGDEKPTHQSTRLMFAEHVRGPSLDAVDVLATDLMVCWLTTIQHMKREHEAREAGKAAEAIERGYHPAQQATALDRLATDMESA